jgi:hypothetical protein
VLERGFDLVLVVEAARGVEKAIRGQADVTVRELVVNQAEAPAA